jgi:hypothetical protein
LPELVGHGTLVFNLTTLANIMLGHVDNWNHSAIRELNPTLVDYLPNQPITVVTPIGAPTIMLVFTQALSQASPEFNQIVCCSPHISHFLHSSARGQFD